MSPVARHREHRFERVGLDAQHHPASFGGDADRCRGRDDDRRACGRTRRLDACRDARHAHVADEQQPSGAAQIDPLVVDRPERARQKLDRHQPAPAGAHDRRGQRHDAAVHRCHRLIRRRDDRLPAIGDGDSAGERVLADGDLEQRGDVVERDELPAVDDDGRHRPAAVLRDERQAVRARGVLRPRRGGECDAQERDECAALVTRQRDRTRDRRSPIRDRKPNRRLHAYFSPRRCLTCGHSAFSRRNAASSAHRRNGLVCFSRPIVELGRTP